MQRLFVVLTTASCAEYLHVVLLKSPLSHTACVVVICAALVVHQYNISSAEALHSLHFSTALAGRGHSISTALALCWKRIGIALVTH